MEFYQLNYFLEVVRQGGVNKAARRLNVSAPAISKAISNLEENLSTSLFDRSGRELTLTEAGKHLVNRAEEIAELVQKTQAEIKGTFEIGEVKLIGREVFLQHYGIMAASVLRRKFPGAVVQFIETSGAEALSAVASGQAHLAFTIQSPPPGWHRVALGKLRLVPIVGQRHPLFARKNAIPVHELAQYEFVSPNLPLFGRTANVTSKDGWRDDLFPRKVTNVVESLIVFRELILSGQGVGFVPDFWAKNIGAKILRVDGQNFGKTGHIYCSSSRSQRYGWLRDLVTEISKAANSY